MTATATTHPFRARLGGEWRAAAPTYAQVLAHAIEHDLGQWWCLCEWGAPSAYGLSTGDDDDGRGPYVFDDEGEVRHDQEQWDEDGREDWRGECLVCPCDDSGVPVDWPVVEVKP